MAPFVLFGPSHIAAMLLTVAVAVALIALVRLWAEARDTIRWALAALLTGVWAWWYVLAWHRGWLTIGDSLPMNLCDWATVATIIALLRPSQQAYELAYFWALGGTLQGMITPDTPFDFPEVRFVIFFIYHGAIIAGVLFLTFRMHYRPWLRSIPRVALCSIGYLIAAGAVDAALGTNYGFLRAKPAQLTLFAALSPWPYYIPELVLIGFLSAAILYAPWFVADRLRGRPVLALPNP
jgi:hypothetical integral membrane protein (TIGR02206 family)